MKFSNIFAFGLATLTVATPVEKRSTPISSALNSVTSELSGLDKTAGVIVSDVEKLVSTIVSDVEGIASAAGIDVSSILTSSGLSLTKRSEFDELEAKRDIQAIETAVTKLITDILGDLSTLSSDAGISLVGTILSTLNL